jgi:hypothetical protein
MNNSQPVIERKKLKFEPLRKRTLEVHNFNNTPQYGVPKSNTVTTILF